MTLKFSMMLPLAIGATLAMRFSSSCLQKRSLILMIAFEPIRLLSRFVPNVIRCVSCSRSRILMILNRQSDGIWSMTVPLSMALTSSFPSVCSVMAWRVLCGLFRLLGDTQQVADDSHAGVYAVFGLLEIVGFGVADVYKRQAG